MINIVDIYKKNRATYYNYATNQINNIWQQRVLIGLISLLMSILFFNTADDVFTTVITIYSILMGFSFNVVILLSSMEFEKISSKDYIEDKLLKRKINKLLEELFYNISFFNLLSICLVFYSLLSFVSRGANECFKRIINYYLSSVFHWDIKKIFKIEGFELGTIVDLLSNTIHFSYLFIFYFLLLSSVCAFVRTTERVSYFFREKIQLKKK